jgi:hypothetical protein
MGKGRPRHEGTTVNAGGRPDVSDERLAELRQVAAEIRDATRDAHGVLGDLRRERKHLSRDIRDGFDKLIIEHAEQAIEDLRAACKRHDERVYAHVEEFITSLTKHIGTLKDKIAKRVEHIEITARAGDSVAAGIAVGVLNAVGGTFKLSDDVSFHLVSQQGGPNTDGSEARAEFTFPPELAGEDFQRQLEDWITEQTQRIAPDYRPVHLGSFVPRKPTWPKGAGAQ